MFCLYEGFPDIDTVGYGYADLANVKNARYIYARVEQFNVIELNTNIKITISCYLIQKKYLSFSLNKIQEVQILTS